MGLVLFLFGFLLTRRSLTTHSTFGLKNEKEVQLPWQHQLLSHDKVILFIIDGIRIDMMAYHNDDILTCASKYICNNLEYMQHLLRHNSSQSRLLTFKADPPTVTSQRIQALMTGTLPSFIDIASNFNAKGLIEDDLLFQLRSNNRTKHYFLGDDTWGNVYPSEYFVKSFPFDSFNTRDLDSVDNGIVNNIWQVYNDSEWDVLIMHFLGLDHVGHTHDISHPLMRAKLQEYDRLMQQVVASLPEDALFLLFGDHGMTNDGNHGGSSSEETDSGLFIYSKRSIFPDKLVNETGEYIEMWDAVGGTREYVDINQALSYPRLIQQIDLVPTLSLLLKIPIPYSSIGKIIPELFFMSWENIKEIVAVNLHQVVTYLNDYYGHAAYAIPVDASVASSMLYLDQIQFNCRKSWTEFNTPCMAIGMYFTHSILAFFNVISSFLGICIMFICLMSALYSTSPSLRQLSSPSPPVILAGLVCIHCGSTFSDNGIEQELHILFLLCILSTLLLSYWGYYGDGKQSCSRGHLLVTTLVIAYLAHRQTKRVSSLLVTIGGVAAICGGLVWLSRCRDYYTRNFHTLTSFTLFGITQVLHCCIIVHHYHTGSNHMLMQRWVIGCNALGLLHSILLSRSTPSTSSALTVLHFYSLLTVVSQPLDIIVSSLVYWYVISSFKFLDAVKQRNYAVCYCLQLLLLSRLLYFLSNHQHNFSALQLEVGFVGTQQFQYSYAGLLLALNTFGYDILALLWIVHIRSTLDTKVTLRVIGVGRLCAVHCSCFCVLLLNRHLRLWAVYGPKAVFETVFYVINCIILLITD